MCGKGVCVPLSAPLVLALCGSPEGRRMRAFSVLAQLLLACKSAIASGRMRCRL